jgi:hypothetical protein
MAEQAMSLDLIAAALGSPDALETLLRAVQQRKPTQVVAKIIAAEGEDLDLALASWRAAHAGAEPDFVVIRVILADRKEGAAPDPDKCTAASVAAAAPAVRDRLAYWHTKNVDVSLPTKHWAGLTERFGIPEE